MKKILCVIALTLMTSQSAFAILSPLYQSVIEIKSILQCEDLPRFLHQGDPILDIQKTPKGYEIFTQQVRMDIDVIYRKSQKIGPQEFDLHFNPPVSLNRENQENNKDYQRNNHSEQLYLNR